MGQIVLVTLRGLEAGLLAVIVLFDCQYAVNLLYVAYGCSSVLMVPTIASNAFYGYTAIRSPFWIDLAKKHAKYMTPQWEECNLIWGPIALTFAGERALAALMIVLFVLHRFVAYTARNYIESIGEVND